MPARRPSGSPCPPDALVCDWTRLWRICCRNIREAGSRSGSRPAASASMDAPRCPSKKSGKERRSRSLPSLDPAAAAHRAGRHSARHRARGRHTAGRQQAGGARRAPRQRQLAGHAAECPAGACASARRHSTRGHRAPPGQGHQRPAGRRQDAPRPDRPRAPAPGAQREARISRCRSRPHRARRQDRGAHRPPSGQAHNNGGESRAAVRR